MNKEKRWDAMRKRYSLLRLSVCGTSRNENVCSWSTGDISVSRIIEFFAWIGIKVYGYRVSSWFFYVCVKSGCNGSVWFCWSSTFNTTNEFFVMLLLRASLSTLPITSLFDIYPRNMLPLDFIVCTVSILTSTLLMWDLQLVFSKTLMCPDSTVLSWQTYSDL